MIVLKTVSIILLTVFVIIGIIATIWFISTLFEKKIKVGDIIIKKIDYENPLNQFMNFETVIEVKKSKKNGRYYFRSYTSHEDGIPKVFQSDYVAEHSKSGKKFYSEDWVKVGSIAPEEVDELIPKKYKRDGKEEDKES